MLLELVKTLTTQQNRELIARGIPQSRLSEWKYEKGLPVIEQLPDLAEVTGTRFEDLARDLAILRAKSSSRSRVESILGKAVAAGVAVMLAICGVVGSAQLAGPNGLSRRR